jgi:2,4-dienoyl-CoA reductase-like NADH-dependent reductase (Old Yellow Enzyme family)
VLQRRTGVSVTHHRIFDAAEVCGLKLANRIVMSPMTRSFSPRGIPGPDVAAYYRRRVEGGVGLIITEGTWIPHPSASNDANVPCFHGLQALDGWSRVAREVHAAGGRIIPQLWHCGLVGTAQTSGGTDGCHLEQIGPCGYVGAMGQAPRKTRDPMTQRQIDEVIEAYATAAESAVRLGFDGVAIHGGHGYLIDQFFWQRTNERTDRYGGGLAARSQFAAEVIGECRRRVGPAFPLILRISQWKVQDFAARPWTNPDELQAFLAPLVAAGTDIFDCSQRRYWEPDFDGSELNLAGWVKKLTGKATMTVGSVGLRDDLTVEALDKLTARFDRGEFDLVAVARSLLADPQWAMKMRDGQYERIRAFDRKAIATLD